MGEQRSEILDEQQAVGEQSVTAEFQLVDPGKVKAAIRALREQGDLLIASHDPSEGQQEQICLLTGQIRQVLAQTELLRRAGQLLHGLAGRLERRSVALADVLGLDHYCGGEVSGEELIREFYDKDADLLDMLLPGRRSGPCSKCGGIREEDIPF